jgi:3-dehydroquinate synthase
MKTECTKYTIVINEWNTLKKDILSINPSATFVLVDENTEKYCLHHFLDHTDIPVKIIRIPSGEIHKNIRTCELVWDSLIRENADRHCLLINLGGGVIGDLGGFCAATYMRGIRFIQMPTTLLSQVDASVGGKLGIDYGGYKNMIGLIKNPEGVYIFTDFLKTLPYEHLRSGFAESLKHGLIADRKTWEELSAQKDLTQLDFERLVYNSVNIKKSVTESDPFEKGWRKILNFGHTIGHAVESYWLEKNEPILHGDAIAIGMISEAYLSYRMGKISEAELFDIRNAILRLYGHHPRMVKPRNEILRKMQHDKKNHNGSIQFALLDSLGHAYYDAPVDDMAIAESLFFYEEKM